MHIIKEESHDHSGSETTTTETERGFGMEEEEKMMPPKMRKRWIHQSADALRDMLGRGGSLSGDERMDVDVHPGARGF
jgi:hypothetical protein